MKQLKDYLIEKETLKKDFDANDNSEKIIMHAAYNINCKLVYEAGASIEPYHTESNCTAEQLEDLFGFAYTSSGRFAALWVNNTQARTKYGKPLYFKGIARSEHYNTCLIFADAKSNLYYFYGWEFANYQEQERAKEQAQAWCAFVKKANKLKNIAVSIWNGYAGKQHGKATAAEIQKKLKAAATEIIGSEYASIYIDGYNNNWLNIRGNYGGSMELNFYSKTQFIDKYNTIQEIDAAELTNYEEANALTEITKAEKLAQKIRSKAAELLPLLDAYNKCLKLIHKSSDDAQTHKTDISRIATHGLQDIFNR